MKHEYDAESHVYRINGEIVPSVTDVVSLITAKKYSNIDPSILDYAKRRGTMVHEYCEMYDYGILPNEIEGEVAGYVEAYIQFCHDYKPDWHDIERTLYSDDDGFAGTIDRMGMVGKEFWFADIKSTSAMDVIARLALAAQLGGYDILKRVNQLLVEGEEATLRRCTITKHKGIWLKSNGKYQIIDINFKIPNSEIDICDYFLELLNVYKIMEGAIKK